MSPVLLVGSLLRYKISVVVKNFLLVKLFELCNSIVCLL